MPIELVKEFKIKAICLMGELIEELEMRFDTLTEEEINFLKVLQSSNGEQSGFDGMCEAFGKIMYAYQVKEDMYKTATFQSAAQNQVRSSGYSNPQEWK
jgi:hypothetical protein